MEVAIAGGTAVLKDRESLTNREVKEIRRASRSAAGIVAKTAGFNQENPETWKVMASLTEEDDEFLDLMQRTAILKRLQSWTLDRPIPTNVEEINELPIGVYEPLATAAVDIGMKETLDIEGAQDPKVPTDS